MTEKYYNDYPKEPIGGGNPYYCCSYCKISDPQINGEIKNHAEWCEYRIQKQYLLYRIVMRDLRHYVKEL
jgi:hypothetical protein